MEGVPTSTVPNWAGADHTPKRRAALAPGRAVLSVLDDARLRKAADEIAANLTALVLSVFDDAGLRNWVSAVFVGL